jgi:hypothetical protein
MNCTRLYRVERGSAAKRRRERANSRESAHTLRHAQARSDRQRARASPPMPRAHMRWSESWFCTKVVWTRPAQKVRAMFHKGQKGRAGHWARISLHVARTRRARMAPNTGKNTHTLNTSTNQKTTHTSTHAHTHTRTHTHTHLVDRTAMLETGNMAIGLSAGGAWRVSGQRACPASHGIACREVAQRSMQFDRHVARSNVECPSGPTADAPAHQPLTNDHGAGWPLCRGQGVSGTRDTSRAAWVVRWVVGAVSVNRRRASGGYRHATPCRRRGPP